MTKNNPKITKTQLFSGFFGFKPQFIGIWSKVTEVWVEVGAPRADFASLLLTFGPLPAPGPPRAAAGPVKMCENE